MRFERCQWEVNASDSTGSQLSPIWMHCRGLRVLQWLLPKLYSGVPVVSALPLLLGKYSTTTSALRSNVVTAAEAGRLTPGTAATFTSHDNNAHVASIPSSRQLHTSLSDRQDLHAHHFWGSAASPVFQLRFSASARSRRPPI